jgi:hypothetical protein
VYGGRFGGGGRGNNQMKLLAVIISGLTLASCLMTWVKPGATPDMLKTDLAQCESEATKTKGTANPEIGQIGINADQIWRTCMRAHGWELQRVEQ